MCRTMKEVILSSDNEAKIYLVPDTVAAHLEDYCLDFSVEWIWENPYAAKYRQKMRGTIVAVYTEKDFIDYLNQWVFPEQPSKLVMGLGCSCGEIPDEYKDRPQFNF